MAWQAEMEYDVFVCMPRQRLRKYAAPDTKPWKRRDIVVATSTQVRQ
jgi:hypothetical protein